MEIFFLKSSKLKLRSNTFLSNLKRSKRNNNLYLETYRHVYKLSFNTLIKNLTRIVYILQYDLKDM